MEQTMAEILTSMVNRPISKILNSARAAVVGMGKPMKEEEEAAV
jgi:hypothetical protein